jgi:hypothetical protein
MAFVSADLPLAVRELFLSAVEVGQIALAELGVGEETIEAITEEFIRRDRERLAMQVASGDIMAGRDTIFRPGHGWKPETGRRQVGKPEEHPAVEHPGHWPTAVPAAPAPAAPEEDLPGDPARDPAAAGGAARPVADG